MVDHSTDHGFIYRMWWIMMGKVNDNTRLVPGCPHLAASYIHPGYTAYFLHFIGFYTVIYSQTYHSPSFTTISHYLQFSNPIQPYKLGYIPYPKEATGPATPLFCMQRSRMPAERVTTLTSWCLWRINSSKMIACWRPLGEVEGVSDGW